MSTKITVERRGYEGFTSHKNHIKYVTTDNVLMNH